MGTEEDVEPASREVAVDEDGRCAARGGDPGDGRSDDGGTGTAPCADDADDGRVLTFSWVSGHGSRVPVARGTPFLNAPRCGARLAV